MLLAIAISIGQRLSRSEIMWGITLLMSTRVSELLDLARCLHFMKSKKPKHAYYGKMNI